MTILKQLGCAAALAFAAGAVHAAPILNDWVFNPSGGGFAGGLAIGEYLDVNGNGFIQISAPSRTSTTFTFREHAVFNLVQADGNGRLFPQLYPTGNITATLEAVGTGTFGGEFTFTGGTIRMYQNPVQGQYAGTSGIFGANLGNQIAQFDVLVGGGGKVNANGSPINNGQVSVFAEAKAGMLASGYFFDADGTDLSKMSVGAFAFTNANTISNPSATLVSEVACGFAGFTGRGCNGLAYRNRDRQNFFIGGNGQFKISEIPEPGSVALFGIALAGIGVLRRRVNKA